MYLTNHEHSETNATPNNKACHPNCQMTGFYSYEQYVKLPLHFEADSTFDNIAVCKMVERRVDRAFAINSIGIVAPCIGTTGTKACPCSVFIIGKLHICDIDFAIAGELLIEISNTINLSIYSASVITLPAIAIIGSKTETRCQAVAVVLVNLRAIAVPEAVEIERRPHQLCLRCQRPVVIHGKSLSGFNAERIAEGIMSVCEAVHIIDLQITIIPVGLCLTVNVETIAAIPCERAAQTPALCFDRAGLPPEK